MVNRRRLSSRDTRTANLTNKRMTRVYDRETSCNEFVIILPFVRIRIDAFKNEFYGELDRVNYAQTLAF